MEQNNRNDTEKLYDLKVIENMCRGKADKILKMIETFVGTMPVAINEMNYELGNRNIENVKKVVHSIKPTLSFYGILSLDNVVKKIEQMENDYNGCTGIESLVKQLASVINYVVNDLKNKYLSNR